MVVACSWWPFSRPKKEPVDQVTARVEHALALQHQANEVLLKLVNDAKESERGELPHE